jgi:hypothetical protein
VNCPSPLKLRFDRYLIDNRPYRFDFLSVELVEHVFCEGDLASVDLEPEVIIDHFTFAGMQPGTNFDAKRPDLVGNRAGTATAAAAGWLEAGAKST